MTAPLNARGSRQARMDSSPVSMYLTGSLPSSIGLTGHMVENWRICKDEIIFVEREPHPY